MNKHTTKIRRSFFNIMKGVDFSKRRIPLIMAESSAEGPTIWIIGVEHGDEVGGMVVIHELFELIKKQGLLKGKIYAIPLLNPMGFEMVSRQIPYTKEDLNRSYPGNPNGTLAQRIAFKIHEAIMQSRPDLVLDLHNDWQNSIPYIILENQKNAEKKSLNKKIKKIARRSGLVMIKETDDIPNSLSTTLYKNKIPAITLELGQSHIVNEKNVEIGLNSLINILSFFNMLNSDHIPLSYIKGKKFRKKILHYTDEPRSTKTGIIRFKVEEGDLVKKNQIIAEIFDVFGTKIETIKAKEKGIILGNNDNSVSMPGTSIIAMGALNEI